MGVPPFSHRSPFEAINSASIAPLAFGSLSVVSLVLKRLVSSKISSGVPSLD